MYLLIFVPCRFYFYPEMAADVINSYSRSAHVLVSFSIGMMFCLMLLVQNCCDLKKMCGWIRAVLLWGIWYHETLKQLVWQWVVLVRLPSLQISDTLLCFFFFISLNQVPRNRCFQLQVMEPVVMSCINVLQFSTYFDAYDRQLVSFKNFLISRQILWITQPFIVLYSEP